MMQAINQIMLTHVISQIKAGKLRNCEELGFTPEELSEINKLTVDELIYLGQVNTSFIHFNINHNLLNKMLQRSKEQSYSQDLFDRALLLGGSIELMKYFFGVQGYEVSERRRLLQKCISAGRRSAYISDEKSNDAWYLWQDECKKDPQRSNLCSLKALDSLISIAEKLDLDLTMLWKQVKKWEDDKKRRIK